MDIFPGWEHHAERIAAAWDRTVAPSDTVVLPGDLSWGMNLSEALEDFLYVQERPGRKIILKGNHDYYWTTMKKMTGFLEEHRIDSVSVLHNNSYAAEGVQICGTRGWMPENADAFNKKIIDREAQRLRTSLASAQGKEERIVFLHYPPMDKEGRPIEPLTDALKEFGVLRCFYGHLHGQSIRTAPEGIRGGIDFKLVSADGLGFQPFLIETGRE